MQISEIIAEADVRMPNSFSSAQKVSWLNEVNQEFFDVVKIPSFASFTIPASGATGTYTVPNDVRAKNIYKMFVGSRIYSSIQYEDVTPGRNYWTLDEVQSAITIVPDGFPNEKGVITYAKIGTTTFVSATLTTVPDAPKEYHWLYILGLCERIAIAMDDIAKSNNFGSEYRTNLSTAQANYINTK